jgi:hypothetical protein
MTDTARPAPRRPLAEDPYLNVVTPWAMNRMERVIPDEHDRSIYTYSLHEYPNGRYLVRYFQGSAREVTFAHPPEYYRDENGGGSVDRILEIMPDIGDSLTRD